MRKFMSNFYGPLVVAMAMMLSASAAAQESDWSFGIGLKGWYNNWATFGVVDDPSTGTYVEGTTSEAVVVPLASGAVRYKDYFLNLGVFSPTKYEFPKSTVVVDTLGGPVTIESTLSAKRQEVDLNLGWYLHPQFAVTIGYKVIEQEYTFRSTGGGFSATDVSTTTIKIPTVGMAATGFLGESNWFLYGNAAFGPEVDVSFSSGSDLDSEKVSGWYAASEIGMGFVITKNLSLIAAYKYQTIHQEIETTVGTQIAPDSTYGFSAGVNLNF